MRPSTDAWVIRVERFADPDVVSVHLYKPRRTWLRRRLKYRVVQRLRYETQILGDSGADYGAVNEVLGSVPLGAGYMIDDPQGEPGRWENWSNSDAFRGLVDG